MIADTQRAVLAQARARILALGGSEEEFEETMLRLDVAWAELEQARLREGDAVLRAAAERIVGRWEDPQHWR
jgi:hypothetical protein